MVKNILVTQTQDFGLEEQSIQKEKKKRIIEKRLIFIGQKILINLHLYAQIEEK